MAYYDRGGKYYPTEDKAALGQDAAKTALEKSRAAEQSMSAEDQAALKAAGDAWNAANAAGDQAAKDKAHADAEAIRARYNYSGGTSGTDYIEKPAKTEYQTTATADELTQSRAVEELMRQNFPEDWALLQSYGQQYNDAVAAGDMAAAAQAHALAEQLRAQYGYSGGADGAGYTMVQAQPQQMGLTPQQQTIYNQLSAQLGYTPGALPQPVTYDPKYLEQYFKDFNGQFNEGWQNIIDEYGSLEEALKAANEAATEKGRLDLLAQLENAKPQFAEQRRRSALAQAKAANNVAAYNAWQGNTGGIGSAQYSAEMNSYDQQMRSIELEEINLVNTTNQEIAKLESEGRYQEAQIAYEIGAAKLSAMQSQYQQYWDAYQNIAAQLDQYGYNNTMNSFNQQMELWQANEQMKQQAFNNALNKLQLGYVSESDLEALGLTAEEAKQYTDYINQMRDYDLQSAAIELQSLANKAASYGSGSGSGSGGGGGSYFTDEDGNLVSINAWLAANEYSPYDVYQLAMDGYFGKTYQNSTAAKQIQSNYESYLSGAGGGDEMPTVDDMMSVSEAYDWMARNGVSADDARLILGRMGFKGDDLVSYDIGYRKYLNTLDTGGETREGLLRQDATRIYVDGLGRALTMAELEAEMNRGNITASYDTETGQIVYHYNPVGGSNGGGGFTQMKY